MELSWDIAYFPPGYRLVTESCYCNSASPASNGINPHIPILKLRESMEDEPEETQVLTSDPQLEKQK